MHSTYLVPGTWYRYEELRGINISCIAIASTKLQAKFYQYWIHNFGTWYHCKNYNQNTSYAEQ